MVGPESSSKISFDNLPPTSKEVEVVIDNEDVLIVDNRAKTVIKETGDQSVLMVSSGNLFLEKVLKLESNLKLYQVTPPDNEMVYEGYDLYIFDEVMPLQWPEDGALLFFNPPVDERIDRLGYVEQPDLATAGHTITNAIDQPEFIAGITQVFNLPTTGQSIYDTTYGSCAYSFMNGTIKGVVYGFDIHQTDLPLSIEFPILMSSTIKHLLTTRMTDVNHIGSGESVEIFLRPSTEQAYVINPDGLETQLDMSRQRQLFFGTDKLGKYEIIQRSSRSGISTNNNDEDHNMLVETFIVNSKKPYTDEATGTSDSGNTRTYNDTRSLKLWLGMLVIAIMLIEWLIYTGRRRKHVPIR